MTTAVATNTDMIGILGESLYPGANPHSISMVLAYCAAAGLDPMLKPVHIVPMWDRNSGRMRDVVMPGIGHYRIQASRSSQFAGVDKPTFGPDVTASIGGMEITYPSWCEVTVRRLMGNGSIALYTAVERWVENYAVKGGKDKSVAPNAMWAKRPYGQLAKCAEAQALRKAFPEFGAAPTAEEMEGRPVDEEKDMGAATVVTAETVMESKKVVMSPGPDLLKRIEAATTVEDMTEIANVIRGIADPEEKEIARDRYKARIATLKAAAKAAAEPKSEVAPSPGGHLSYAEVADLINAGKTEDEVLDVCHLIHRVDDEEQRKDLMGLAGTIIQHIKG